MDAAAGLSRACDRATADRPAGAPLFWTLGANQTGKAAITAWRDLLLPALAGPSPPALWPFDGALLPICWRRGGSWWPKPTRPRPCGSLACGWAAASAATPTGWRWRLSLRDRMAGLRMPGPPRPWTCWLATGFGADAAGEDRLDCLLGLLGLLQVLTGRRANTVPDDPAVRRWEGWVLGQSDPGRHIMTLGGGYDDVPFA